MRTLLFCILIFMMFGWWAVGAGILAAIALVMFVTHYWILFAVGLGLLALFRFYAASAAHDTHLNRGR